MDNAHLTTNKRIKRMERRLTQIYKEDAERVQKMFSDYLQKFEAADKKKLAMVENGRMTEKQYEAWRKKTMARGEKYKDMQREIAEELARVNKTAIAYINGELPDIYALNYNAVEGATSALKGYSFNMVNVRTVRLLATRDESLLPFKVFSEKDIPWNMRNIHGQVMRGIEKGESIPKIARRIREVQFMNLNQSIRTARTIVTAAENKARLDSYKKLESDGVIVEKKWLSVHDARTRDWHLELDGQTRKVGEPFENSVGKIMFPGDPSAHPANVYNCRCALVSVIKGFERVKK